MVQALMHSNNLIPPNQVDAPNQVVESSHKGGRSPKDSNKEEHSSKVAPQRRCIPHSPNVHQREAAIQVKVLRREVKEEDTFKRGEGLPLHLQALLLQ